MVTKFLTALAATAMVAVPVAANAQGASALSIAKTPVVKSARASTPAKGSNKLAGAGLLPLLLGAAIVAGGVYLAVDDDNSDSN